MRTINFGAFTLVELIVVITIVGILSTVGFVSYSGYLAGARDSNRISQMVKLSDSLQVYSTTKTLPIPDNYVEIQASGSTIAYQGELGVDVLETIDYTNGGTDPKDDSYYTYYLSKNRKNLQLMAFLEEQGSTTSLPLKIGVHEGGGIISHTYAADYSDRYPKVYGKKLGTLVQSGTNTPIQQLSLPGGVLDIATTPDNYISYFNTDEIYTGTGVNLIFGYSLHDKSLSRFDPSLVAYWDMQTITSDGKLEDLSINSNDGICMNTATVVPCGGSVGPQFVTKDDKEQILFDGIDDWINLGNDSSLNLPSSFSFYLIFDIATHPTATGPILAFRKGGLNNYAVSYYNTLTAVNSQHYEAAGTYKTNVYTNNYSSGDKVFLTYVYDATVDESYAFGHGSNKNIKTGVLSPNTTNDILVLGNQRVYVPTDTFFNSYLDELRLYNRALTDQEVQALYRRTRVE